MFTRIMVLVGMTVVLTQSALAKDAEPLRDTESIKFNHVIPNMKGKKMVSVVVDYPAGAKSVSHRHAKSAFIYIYVLKGAVRSQVNDEPAKIYHEGDSWYEAPGAHHKVSENVSSTEPAKLLAVFLVDSGNEQLTIPDK